MVIDDLEKELMGKDYEELDIILGAVSEKYLIELARGSPITKAYLEKRKETLSKKYAIIGTSRVAGGLLLYRDVHETNCSEMYEKLMNDGYFFDAALVAECGLGETKVKNAAEKCYEKSMYYGDFPVAERVAKKYGLGRTKVLLAEKLTSLFFL